jgi:ketosteroid isomerase-like protein
MTPTRLFTLLLLFALVPVCARAAVKKPRTTVHKKDAKLQIEDLEKQWTQATLTGDAVMMDKLLATDYVGINMAGQIATKQQQLDRLSTRSTHITALTLSDTNIKLVHSIAIVTGLAEVDGTNEGENVKGEYRYTRVYQLQPSGAWQITNFEVTRIPKNRQIPPAAASK